MTSAASSCSTDVQGARLAVALQDIGYWTGEGAENFAAWAFYDACAWNDFSHAWDDLLIDTFMRDGGTYRYRRYSQLLFEAGDGTLTLLPHEPYEQPAAINKLNGGFPRHFDPLDEAMLQNAVFRGLMTWLGRTYSTVSGHERWNIKLHPYRIMATTGAGEPSPEGLHRDGVDYICSLLVRRCNVFGAETVITDAHQAELARFTMSAPGDIMVADDNAVMHGVSAVEMSDARKPVAYRDVLVVAFTKD